MTDTLVKVENISKKFCRSLKRSLWYGLQDLGSELLGRRHGREHLRSDEFWAVKDVSFELKRGECVGLIGRNGAGKTTILRMLNGLIKPDAGRIEIRGRVGALIALGAGFNPILSGRENVHVAGSILGLSSKEIKKKYDAIVDFAELEEFMESPVQTYSSGMHVRLGFAVAAHMEPDVLLIDEILAVGDAQFNAKCTNRIRQLQHDGVGVILVSHNMTNILRYSTSGLYLNRGKMMKSGAIDAVYASYAMDQDPLSSLNLSKNVKIDSGIEFGNVYVTNPGGNLLECISPHEPVILHVPYQLTSRMQSCDVELQLGVDDSSGVFYQGISDPFSFSGGAAGRSGEFLAAIESLPAATGKLSVGVALWEHSRGTVLAWTRDNHIHVTAPTMTAGRVALRVNWTISTPS